VVLHGLHLLPTLRAVCLLPPAGVRGFHDAAEVVLRAGDHNLCYYWLGVHPELSERKKPGGNGCDGRGLADHQHL